MFLCRQDFGSNVFQNVDFFTFKRKNIKFVFVTFTVLRHFIVSLLVVILSQFGQFSGVLEKSRNPGPRWQLCRTNNVLLTPYDLIAYFADRKGVTL